MNCRINDYDKLIRSPLDSDYCVYLRTRLAHSTRSKASLSAAVYRKLPNQPARLGGLSSWTFKVTKIIISIAMLIMIISVSGCGSVSGNTSRKSVAGIPDPVQKEASGGTSFELDGFDVKVDYQYSYDISALVVSTHDYSDHDIGGKLAPRDFALAWGPVAEYNDRIDFHWRQSNRWYYWQTNTYDEINVVGGVDGVTCHSANNHLIAADDKVKKIIKSIDAGDYIRLKGYLVNINASKSDGTNFWWNSSTERSDSGDGSCEVIYVTEAEILQ